MRHWTGILTTTLMLAASPVGAAPAAVPPVMIEGAQQHLIPHIVGRYRVGLSAAQASKDKGFLVPTATYQWPGTYFDAAFKGDTVFVRLNDSANILNVLIDGKRIATLNKPGEVIETYKGDTSPKRECTKDEIWATTDTQQAWGPLTAKHYKADYQVNAYSGIGFVRNYDGSAGDTMPQRYPYALFDSKVAYTDETWKPQIIVIALGGNDFSTPVRPNEKWASEEALTSDFEATYVRFVKDLRSHNPDAGILLLSYDPGRISNTIQTVMTTLQTTGESHIGFLEVSGFTQTGCDWHLDLNDHIKVAGLVETYIDSHPDLWPQTWSPTSAK